MSNIKFYTNRQVALQMAMKEAKGRSGTQPFQKFILELADTYYEWLQDAPMKDEDKDDRFWFDVPTKIKPKGK
jgi:dsDNA-binding SOS-regulon protein